MGIPGLLGAVSKETEFHKPNYYRNACFYVDGLNFTSLLANKIKPNKIGGVYADFVDSLENQIQTLKAYSPKCIEFYFDAYFPLTKVPIREQRKVKQLKEAGSHRKISHKSVLAMKYVLQRHRDIKVVYTGLEAEDQIIKVIHDRSVHSPECRHVVFSSDSDLFTFRLSNARYVDIVPILGHRLKRTGLESINIGTLFRRQPSHLTKSFMRDVPDHLDAKSMVATRPMDDVVKFLNGINSHNLARKELPILYALPGVNPYDAGSAIRRASYGLFFRKWCNGQVRTVEEGCQEDGEMSTRFVEALQGSHLDQTKEILTTHSVADIITNQMSEVKDKYGFDENDVQGCGTYINDLVLNAKIRQPPQKVSMKAEIMFPLLKAILSSLIFWEEVLGGVLAKDNLIWRISAHELSLYVHGEPTVQLVQKPRLVVPTRTADADSFGDLDEIETTLSLEADSDEENSTVDDIPT